MCDHKDDDAIYVAELWKGVIVWEIDEPDYPEMCMLCHHNVSTEELGIVIFCGETGNKMSVSVEGIITGAPGSVSKISEDKLEDFMTPLDKQGISNEEKQAIEAKMKPFIALQTDANEIEFY